MTAGPIITQPTSGQTGVTNPTVFTWSAIASADTYDIQVATTAAFTTLIHDDTGLTTTTRTYTDILALSSRSVRVRAVISGTPTDWSGTITFTRAALTFVKPTTAILDPDHPLYSKVLGLWAFCEPVPTAANAEIAQPLSDAFDGVSTGTLPAREADAVYGPVAAFTGTEAFKCGNIGDFERTDKFSILVIFQKPDVTIAQYFISKLASVNSVGWRFLLNTNETLEFRFQSSSTKTLRATLASTANNVWIHQLLTLDGSATIAGVKNYRDGVTSAVTNTADTLDSGSTKNPTQELSIGCRVSGATIDSFFIGKQAFVVLFNDELTASEAVTLYNNATGLLLAVPDAPVLTSPTDGKAEVEAVSVFTWDAAARATTYQIQVSTDAAFTSPIHDDAGISALTKTYADIPAMATYYWRVRGTGPSGTGAWSTTFTFTRSADSRPDVCFAVQITTAEPAQTADAAVGLIDGDFRWVTGRPGFTAAAPPTGENDGDVWYEGFLNQPEDFGPAVRMIDVTTAGGYGTLQGIKFSIDNTAAFQDYLEDNDIFLANRAVKVYAVIAGVFTQIWAGVISDMSWDELNYTFACESDYKRIHKNLPPNKIDAVSFPRADNKVIGSTIPICFGYVQHARLFNLDGRPDAINLSGTDDIRFSASTSWVDGGGILYIRLKTPSASFGLGDLAGKMLHVIRGNEQSVYILTNLATAGSGASAYTDIYLDMPLTGVTVANFNANNIYTNPPTDNIWWFEVINQGSAYTPSQSDLVKFIEQDDTTKRSVVEYFESDAGEYNNIWELVRRSYATSALALSGNGYTLPNVVLASNSRQLIRGGGVGFMSGDIVTDPGNTIRFAPTSTYTGNSMICIPIVPVELNAKGSARTWFGTIQGGPPKKIITPKISVSSSFGSNVIDRSRATSGIISATSTDSFVNDFDVKFPRDKLSGSVDELYLMFDVDITCPVLFSLTVTIKKIDPFGNPFSNNLVNQLFPNFAAGSPVTLNFLPDAYYANGGDLNGETSYHMKPVPSECVPNIIGQPYSVGFKMDTASVSNLSDLSGDVVFRLTATYHMDTPNDISVAYKQIGFIAKTAATFRSWDIFTAVKSTIGTTVYDALDKIVSTYDGIAAGSLDLTGIANRRGLSWPVGRQVLDQKNSAEYITELARQSFVGVFPNRTGKLALKAFREFSTVVKAFDASNIIAGSIGEVRKTPNDEVYNEFDIQYAWDEGRKKFMRSLSIANSDAAAFPTSIESTGTDTAVDFTSMVIRQNSSGTWQANILVESPLTDPTWAVAGAYVSYYGNSNGAAFSYQRVSGKYGSGPWTVVVPLDVPPGVYGSWLAVGTLTHHGTGVRKWTTYAGGMTDYQLGKALWTVCHNSYLHTLTKRKAPDELSKCYWFPDADAFADIAGNNSALEYLKALVEWSTRQKDVTQFAVPMRDNLTRELLDFCTFTDAKFTAGNVRQGYVTMVKHDIATCQTILEMILEPTDIDSLSDIQESGSAPDTITETGSATDTITEIGTGV